MRIRITGKGIWSNLDGEFQQLPVGTEVDVSRVPRGWEHRCVVISDDEGKTLVANKPAENKTANDPLDALRTEAASIGVKVDKRWGEDRLREEIEKAQ
jgi:hypothetical protein